MPRQVPWYFRPSTALAGAVISILVEAYDLATNATPNWFTAAFFALTVFFLLLFALGFFREAEALKADRVPKFEIVFEPHLRDGVTDNRPFVQLFDVKVPQLYQDGTPTGKRLPFTDRRFRVGIRSLCAAVVPNVELVLAGCEPRSNDVHPGHRLAVLETQEPARDLAPNQTGEPTLFFDVVSEIGAKGTVPNRFRFCWANPSLTRDVALDHCEIRLRAQGGGYSHERTFLIRKRWDAEQKKYEPLSMEPL
jgi:hypothetical protein